YLLMNNYSLPVFRSSYSHLLTRPSFPTRRSSDLEYASVFHSGIHGVRICERGFKIPDARELPRMLRAVVPHVSRERLAGFRGGVLHELVAFALGRPRLGVFFARWCPWLGPGLAAVIGPLNNLPEPTARLRCIDPIRVGGRTLEVVHLPARKMRATDLPLLAFPVCCQDECALACSNQHPYLAHLSLLCVNCVCTRANQTNHSEAAGRNRPFALTTKREERAQPRIARSEERRVGKECRCRWWRYH